MIRWVSQSITHGSTSHGPCQGLYSGCQTSIMWSPSWLSSFLLDVCLPDAAIWSHCNVLFLDGLYVSSSSDRFLLHSWHFKLSNSHFLPRRRSLILGLNLDCTHSLKLPAQLQAMLLFLLWLGGNGLRVTGHFRVRRLEVNFNLVFAVSTSSTHNFGPSCPLLDFHPYPPKTSLKMPWPEGRTIVKPTTSS